jgi:hypothetical protein
MKIGDKVKMTRDAVENYGSQYAGQVFTISHVATNTNEHPGYDTGVGGKLYDLEGFNSSLYDYELIQVR